MVTTGPVGTAGRGRADVAPRPRPRCRTDAGGVGGLALGVATGWLSLVVLLPLAALATKAFTAGPQVF
jgi:sulfate transport system permease protein